MSLMYFGAAFIIILVILLIIRLLFLDKRDRPMPPGLAKKTILIQTNNGVERISQSELAARLSQIYTQLETNNAGFTLNRGDSSEDELQANIDYAINNLNTFLKENPENGKALCTQQMHTDELTQQMDNSINPTPRDWEATYKSILEYESDDRDLTSGTSKDKLQYLLTHLDLAVRLLRNSVCNINGQLDINKLHDVLNSMKQQIDRTGVVEEPSYTYGPYPFNRYDRPPPLPLFLEDQFSTEPFQSRPNVIYTRPSRASFGSVSKGIINAPHVNSSGHSKNLENFDSILLNSVNNVVNKSFYDVPFSKGSMGDQLVPGNITLMGPDYSEMVEQRSVGDKSLEGTVEQDINGFAPPGHILAQLYDPSDLYTVNVGACAGKVLSDQDVVKECIAPGAADWQAAAGDAYAMLGCVGENCYSPDNYKIWFDKMRDTSAAHDALGIDYYSPASIRNF